MLSDQVAHLIADIGNDRNTKAFLNIDAGISLERRYRAARNRRAHIEMKQLHNANAIIEIASLAMLGLLSNLSDDSLSSAIGVVMPSGLFTAQDIDLN